LFLLERFKELNEPRKEWPLFEELKEFMVILQGLLNSQLSPFEFWEKASTARENYRENTRLGINGNEEIVTIEEIEAFFVTALKKLDEGIEKAWDTDQKNLFTYFYHEVKEYQLIEVSESNGSNKVKYNHRGLPCFRATKFSQKSLPLFLEGPVHYLRCNPEKKEAAKLLKNIQKSDLYDKKLKMYKVNASLSDQPLEIGRTRVFSPGWFENESIWLHMEYKYMLEILRNGFYTEFYQNFKNVFVPFFKAEVYGRSILENSSFIVSSANPDASIHGNGFVARLSGATAEFIHILLLMILGPRPFCLNQKGELQLQFSPAIPGWLFSKRGQKIQLMIENNWQEVEISANSFSFMFLGDILVTYHNPALKDTFGDKGVSPVKWIIVDKSGSSQIFDGAKLTGDIVHRIRDREVKQMDIELR
jgi:hypothetical protein